jgi:hypothetical protein
MELTAEMTVLLLVDRAEMRSLADAVRAILLGEATSTPAGPAVKALFQKMEPALNTMIYPTGVAHILVTYHTPP